MNEFTSEPLVQVGVPEIITRRKAMQWVLAAVATSSLPAGGAMGRPVGRTVTPQEDAARHAGSAIEGYGHDPRLLPVYKPGSFWPLTFNVAQRKTATALADVILPKDSLGPAASEVGVIEMLDEWISAPYSRQKADRPIILDGLVWIEQESASRFGKSFSDISADQTRAICDDICHVVIARNEHKKAAHFFARFRSLCAAAYYSTPQGWAAIGYVGNIPLEKFEGPPPEVLKKLGLE